MCKIITQRVQDGSGRRAIATPHPVEQPAGALGVVKGSLVVCGVKYGMAPGIRQGDASNDYDNGSFRESRWRVEASVRAEVEVLGC